VVDEPGDVSADAGINDGAIRELEAPDVPAPYIPSLPFEAFLIRYLLARVVNDALVLGDTGGGEHAPAMNRRTPFLNHPRSIS
jgi:hypothetical protein